MRLPSVAVAPAIRDTLLQGHPWVYRNHIVPFGALGALPELASGTWVQVHCGKFVGVGLWEAQGAIAVRLFSARQALEEGWLAARVQAAWDLRGPLREGGVTTAYRWVYGESDALPGIVVDLYGQYAAVHFYALGLAALAQPLAEALAAVAPLKGVVLRQKGSGSPHEHGGEQDAPRTETIWGRPPPRELVVLENGLRLRADLLAGQKTGLFLDHRENRLYLQPWCYGRRVLNAFSYTGAFSLYAARGGAAAITSVDISPQAAAEAERNLALNGYDPSQHEFVVADCFDWLAEAAAAGRRFDLVILDPPSLAKDKASRFAAARAYTRLNRLALACLETGGLLASASCTSQVSLDAFREALAAAAAQAGKRLTVLHEAGHALDHPVPAHLPEARYLKFVLARVGEVL
jgi:23S rRNA (cytosine1962-C5)-methyltransferase